MSKICVPAISVQFGIAFFPIQIRYLTVNLSFLIIWVVIIFLVSQANSKLMLIKWLRFE